jgi:hypothetical protein
VNRQTKQFTEIDAGGAIHVTVKYSVRGNEIVAPFRVQLEVLVAPESDGSIEPERARSHNFVIDVPKLQ